MSKGMYRVIRRVESCDVLFATTQRAIRQCGRSNPARAGDSATCKAYSVVRFRSSTNCRSLDPMAAASETLERLHSQSNLSSYRCSLCLVLQRCTQLQLSEEAVRERCSTLTQVERPSQWQNMDRSPLCLGRHRPPDTLRRSNIQKYSSLLTSWLMSRIQPLISRTDLSRVLEHAPLPFTTLRLSCTPTWWRPGDQRVQLQLSHVSLPLPPKPAMTLT